MHPRAQSLIHTLGLQPHPEGGYYREVFRSGSIVQREDPAANRTALTTIYFLLTAGDQSRWHRVTSDEVWHFYEGDPLELLWLDEGGTQCERHRLGPVNDTDARPVRVVPAGRWQAARPTGDYTLVGCSVAPGFEFGDFTMLSDLPEEAAELRRNHPDLATLI